MSNELDEERELATELDLMEYRTMPVSELALAIIERTAWGQRVQAQREACEFAAEYARVTEVRDKARAALGKEA